MKEEIALKEKLKLLEQELVTLVDKLSEIEGRFNDLDDLKDEMKAIKLFLSKEYPDFKSKFPELLKKVCS
jgi:hypothetical protein